jgi:hypothetical protein
VQWVHLEYEAPGQQGGGNKPTVINGKPWSPQWPGKLDPNQNPQIESGKYDRLDPPMPQSAMKINLKTIKAREEVHVVQEPSAENQYTLIVEFNDGTVGGADDYIVEITGDAAQAPLLKTAYKTSLPSGLSAEVLAVSRTDADGWWAPDGGKLAHPPTLDREMVFLNADTTTYRVLVKVNSKDSGATFKSRPGSRSSGTSTLSGSPGDFRMLFYVTPPPKTQKLGIDVGVGIGEWKTIVKHEKLDVEEPLPLPYPKASKMVFKPVEMVANDSGLLSFFGAKHAKFTVMQAWQGLPDNDYRMVVISGGKVIHPNRSMSRGGNNGDIYSTCEYEFSELGPDSIERIEFQARPREWMHLENISLVPGK